MNQMNPGKSGQKRQVYMDFAPAKRPAVAKSQPGTTQLKRKQPAVLKPNARAVAANAKIAEERAAKEAKLRAERRAKMGVPGTRVAVPRPGVKPAVRPAPKPVSTSSKPKAPTQKPKFVAKPAERPVAKRPLSEPRPVTPYVKQKVETETRVTDTPKGRLVEQEAYEEIDFGVIEDYQSPEALETSKEKEAGEVAKKPAERSNWPFLKSVTVEKRPLSGKAPAAKKPAKAALTTVTPAASSIALNSGVARKKSKLPMVGLVLLTIVLGVAVGAAVYFAIFQSGGPE